MALNLLIKPASGNCNMRCKYCFYVDETKKRSQASMGVMSSETMDIIVRKIYSENVGDCSIAFQGGEPTLAGLEFFQHLSRSLQDFPNPFNVKVHLSMQTNGLALNEEWAKWFAENQVLVGVSLDGPRYLHDRYRVDAEGNGTFRRIMDNIRLLEKYNVDFNILTVVSADGAKNATNIYKFFRQNGFNYQQYIECLDPLGEAHGGYPYSLSAGAYADFLKNTFDAWYQDMKNGRYVYNRYFENLMMILAGQGAESCSLHGYCSNQFVIEADGSVYPCDFYVLDEWKLGSIISDSWQTLNQARENTGFVALSLPVPDKCRRCKIYALCRNGCRRCREASGSSVPENIFCEAYSTFIPYALPKLQEILELLRRKVNQQT